MIRRRLLAGIASLAVVLSGCAGSPAVAPSSPSDATASASAEAPATAAPTAVVPSPSIGPVPAVIAPQEPLMLLYHCCDGESGIFVMALDGTDVRRLAADVPGLHKHPDWSPDGQHVVFTVQETNQMWIAHLDGSPSTRIGVCDRPGCDYPAWSPDGTRIAFSRTQSVAGVIGPAALTIEILDLATMETTPVIRLERPLLVDVPRWSPDGTELVVGVDRMDDGANEIGAAVAIVPAAGGDLRYLTDFELFGYNPDWDPTRDLIVFSTEVREFQAEPEPEDTTWDLYTIRPDGTDLVQITDAAPGERLWNPRWTPDGSMITAADQSTFTGVWVDPSTGDLDPFPTDLMLARPQVRPLPVSEGLIAPPA